ncbi:TonB family protein [Geomonas sp. RF6]|uniref:energy transducer TonB n=1 Tax=Geomonas sp. RF6 TaxID=2897342 RepID=UPI001E2F3217|nr:energy transducer TonB [Geomonas sp. RF6]UFS70342.1 TonB family protein [Geomonas sp. RF6]
MSDKYVEKSFLYLIFLSVLLHVAIFTALLHLAPERKPPAPEPQMLDLNDFRELPPIKPKKEVETKRRGAQKRRVPREVAPKGESEFGRGEQKRDTVSPAEKHLTERGSRGRVPRRAPPVGPAPSAETPGESSAEGTARATPRGEGLFKPKGETGQGGEIAKLFPSGRSLARTEESYRKKYGPEVEDGTASFLNSDDILFGSFLMHFERAVYGVWHYPQAAAEQGIQGVTPVKITFNRRGEIEKVELLETSGSRILDNEVLRTLRMIGRVGSFPKSYQHETFNLIAFFHYKIGGGRLLR